MNLMKQFEAHLFITKNDAIKYLQNLRENEIILF